MRGNHHGLPPAASVEQAIVLAQLIIAKEGGRSKLLHNGSLPQEEIGTAITNFRLVLERLFEATLAESK
jgi:hypothetical protein